MVLPPPSVDPELNLRHWTFGTAVTNWCGLPVLRCDPALDDVTITSRTGDVSVTFDTSALGSSSRREFLLRTLRYHLSMKAHPFCVMPSFLMIGFRSDNEEIDVTCEINPVDFSIEITDWEVESSEVNFFAHADRLEALYSPNAHPRVPKLIHLT